MVRRPPLTGDELRVRRLGTLIGEPPIAVQSPLHVGRHLHLLDRLAGDPNHAGAQARDFLEQLGLRHSRERSGERLALGRLDVDEDQGRCALRQAQVDLAGEVRLEQSRGHERGKPGTQRHDHGGGPTTGSAQVGQRQPQRQAEIGPETGECRKQEPCQAAQDDEAPSDGEHEPERQIVTRHAADGEASQSKCCQCHEGQVAAPRPAMHRSGE
jgi:hypothetical protein